MPRLQPPPKFHRLHYNFVAKRLRNHYPEGGTDLSAEELLHIVTERGVVEDIALEFAEKFKEDNFLFNAFAFLDQCSPDPDQWPLSELWEEDDGS